jgi:hypothetical protein
MDPEEQPVNDEREGESQSSDAESDEAGRDTDISDSWGALPATTQQVKAQSAHNAFPIHRDSHTDTAVA